MKSLKAYFQEKIEVDDLDKQIIDRISSSQILPAKRIVIKAGSIEKAMYFLESGIVRGFKNQDGKIIVEHLIDGGSFVASMDSLFNDIPSPDTFETQTECRLIKLSRSGLNELMACNDKWRCLMDTIVAESMNCKMERIRDFQTLTAKERYLKFLDKYPKLALNVSVENMASYLGVEPQSLSRIRKQISI